MDILRGSQIPSEQYPQLMTVGALWGQAWPRGSNSYGHPAVCRLEMGASQAQHGGTSQTLELKVTVATTRKGWSEGAITPVEWQEGESIFCAIAVVGAEKSGGRISGVGQCA